MENTSEVISLMENITAECDYPLALLDDKLTILWFNDNAKEFFKRKEKFSESLSDYAYGFRADKAMAILHSGLSCEFVAKGRVNKKIFLFPSGYSEQYMFIAAWLNADEEVRARHERTKLEMMIFQHNSKTSIQRLFNSAELIERSTALDGDDKLTRAFATMEREAYKLYLMLGELQVMHKELDPFNFDTVRKFDFTEYFNDLINATKLTLTALNVNLKLTNSVVGTRYISANPHNFALSFLKVLKAVVMLTEGAPRNVRISLSEEDGHLLLKMISKNTRVLEFVSDEQYDKTFSEKGVNLERHTYAFGYKIAETIIRRNNMFLESSLDADTTTICIKIPATKDPTGALRSMREVYLGNRFSTVNIVFGDVI